MQLITIPGTNERIELGAGASLARMVVAGMPAGGINDGYRSHAEQVTMFLSRYRVQWTGRGVYGDVRWWKGKRYVRTSGAGMAATPGTSTHGDGLALDLARPQRTWMFAHGAAHGWFNTIKSEPWHWEYRVGQDEHINNTAPTEDEMLSTIRTPDGSIGVITNDLRLVPLTSYSEYQALLDAGAVKPFINQPNTVTWNVLRALGGRIATVGGTTDLTPVLAAIEAQPNKIVTALSAWFKR